MAVGTVSFFFVAISSAVGVSVLCGNLQMLGINTSFVLADMVNKIFSTKRNVVEHFVGDSVSAFGLPGDGCRAIAVTKAAAYPNPAAVNVNITQAKPVLIFLIHTPIIPVPAIKHGINRRTTQESGLAPAQWKTQESYVKT